MKELIIKTHKKNPEIIEAKERSRPPRVVSVQIKDEVQEMQDRLNEMSLEYSELKSRMEKAESKIGITKIE